MLKGEENNSSKTDTSLLHVCTNSAQSLNHSKSLVEELLYTKYREILSILEELENKNDMSNINSQSKLTGHFCSNTSFDLSQKVFPDTEIKILEKDLDYAPIQNKLNKPKLRKDFDDFSRKMRLKWYFRNKATQDFSERSSFRSKSSWKTPQRNASFELFLSQNGSELFEIPKKRLG